MKPLQVKVGDTVTIRQRYGLDEWEFAQRYGQFKWEYPWDCDTPPERVEKFVEAEVVWVKRDGSFQVDDGSGRKMLVERDGHVRGARGVAVVMQRPPCMAGLEA